jgi:predicted transcriptional regulator
MTGPAITDRPGDAVAKAATLVVENGVERLPVIDETGAVVGIAVRADVMDASVQPDSQIAREIREDVIQQQMWASPGGLTGNMQDGVVTLAGEVENETLASVLPRMVARVLGVVDVLSRLAWVGRESRVSA